MNKNKYLEKIAEHADEQVRRALRSRVPVKGHDIGCSNSPRIEKKSILEKRARKFGLPSIGFKAPATNSGTPLTKMKMPKPEIETFSAGFKDPFKNRTKFTTKTPGGTA